MAIPPDPGEQEKLARMEAALLRLPKVTREVFLANRLDHLTYSEIANRTGLSVPQVRRQMTRALLALEKAVRREARPWWRFW